MLITGGTVWTLAIILVNRVITSRFDSLDVHHIREIEHVEERNV